MVHKHIHLIPARNHRIAGSEYTFFFGGGAQNDSNCQPICSSFAMLFSQPHPSRFKTWQQSQSSAYVNTIQNTATSGHVMHNTQVYSETSIVFAPSLVSAAGNWSSMSYLYKRWTQPLCKLTLRQSRALLHYFSVR